ncbi:hypothetical protein G1L02_07925 [Tenacibaculum finnmarkense]|uniref:hypothetical protein n=1 Tax=Tenacibaculum finnmarkense TaxID=2781243 RepID=UPI0007394735|nr:hypothetical protein [Tenacibaculum finnmarkense]ALU74403.1 hypothetical protein AUW17_03570 [Tenacibaculum dicentrarchi]MBE7634524.1 hypothetical protein [Tenacibaculum finnmarkense genomovar ulcerans]MBE7646173.1 hypothetical protein [Tenacibaculum finnmarkense genomovar ulcerans]MBE7688523.1 hypothetical protein [Tenacibaculum finnmarkense genomovar ulcerans]MCD8400818.1 hypothetical protein [Tenacibaculum finnmarkense genomovar ulcerans]
MKKAIPFIYIILGVFILVESIPNFLEDKESYRVFFGITTQSKYIYLLVKVLFASLFLVDGINKVKKQ